MSNQMIFGDITITEVSNDWKEDSVISTISTKRCFDIRVTDEPIKRCFCDNLDKVLLFALELKYEGNNGNFAEYADSMLSLSDDAELWR